MQLLSPAASSEAVIAAVQNGADMVYIEYGAIVRDGCMGRDELAQSIRYCRVRGCGVAVTMDELLTEQQLEPAMERAVYAAQLGASAILVRDLGLIHALRQLLPDVALWGSVRLGIHSLDGAKTAAALGLSRITLAPELTAEQIAAITAGVSIETAVCVHGSVCFSYSGLCYMSAMNEQGQSDSTLRCSLPCRQRLSLGGRMDDYPLSMPDRCLISHLDTLEEAGVACAVIGSRDSRPEHIGYITGLYAKAIRERVLPTAEELDWLAQATNPHGLSAGAMDDAANLIAPPTQPDRAAERFLADVRKGYMQKELRRVPVTMYVVMQRGRKALFAAEDDQGHRAVYEGYAPIDLGRQGLSPARVREIFYRSGGTPYSCDQVQCAIDQNLDYAPEAMETARKNLLSQITEARREPPAVRLGNKPAAPLGITPPAEPKVIIQITAAEQLTEALADTEPDYLYAPAELLAADSEGLAFFRERGTKIVAVLPPIVTDEEMPTLRELLATLRGKGYDEVLTGNMGTVPAILHAGMRLRGDYALNMTNAAAMERLKWVGFQSVTASFELAARHVWELATHGHTEMIVYGRVPVMITERCLIRTSAGRCACSTPTSMSDPFGSVYPVEQEFGCRNVVFDGRKIFLADREDV